MLRERFEIFDMRNYRTSMYRTEIALPFHVDAERKVSTHQVSKPFVSVLLSVYVYRYSLDAHHCYCSSRVRGCNIFSHDTNVTCLFYRKQEYMGACYGRGSIVIFFVPRLLERGAK